MTPIATVLARPTRAIVMDAFGGPEVLRLGERPTPAPREGELLVDVEVAGVNFADTMIRRGEYLRDQPLSMGPGAEVVGRVAATGPGTKLAVGTRVAGWLEGCNGYADRVIATERRAYPVPDDLPAAAIAACFLQGTTAYYGVHRFGRTQPGDTVLVHAAAGGVGGLAVQLAKIATATVVATASSAAKLEVAREHGADELVQTGDLDTLAERLLEATGGPGADVIVDGVAGPAFKPSLRALAVRGRYVLVGAASQLPAPLDVRHLLVRNQSVCGFILSHIVGEDPSEPSRALLHLCDLVRDGRLRPRYETLPLEQAAEAHRRIEARTLTGKIVLEVDGA